MRRRSRPCTAPTGNSISSCEPCCAQGRALPEVARRSGARRHFHCEHVTKCPKCPNVGSQVGQNATTNLCGAPTAKLDIKTTAGGASTVSLASSPSLCLTAAVGMVARWQKCAAADTTQQWTFDAGSGAIKPAANAKLCLDVMNQQRGLDAVIDLWPCNAGWNQQWSVRGGDTLQSAEGNVCLGYSC